MASRTSAVAAFVAVVYDPVLLVGTIFAAIALFQPLTDLVPSSMGWNIAMAGGVLCAPLFLIMIFDRQTRHAVDTFNEYLKQQWPSWTWRERLFHPSYGDRTLLLLNRLLWLEAVLSIFADRSVSYVAFAGFTLTTLLLILQLGHPRSTPEA